MQITDQILNNLSTSLILFLLIIAPLHYLYSVWRRTDISTEAKILWTIFLVIAPVISVIIYLAFGYKKQDDH